MNWNRHGSGMRNTKMYLDLLVFALILSFLFKQFIFVAVISFLLLIALVQIIYFHRVGQKFDFVNDKNRIRLIKDTSSHFTLNFNNKGLPIWNANLIISFQKNIEPDRIFNTAVGDFHEVKIPFSIGYNKSVSLKVPIKGVSRGLARIKHLQVEIPHPLTEGSILLEFKPYILLDAIVFPTIYDINEDFAPSKLKQGELALNSSLFDDPFFPVGTREYEPGDQFHHIHWKASAKTQQLQTKIFTRVANVSVLFVINVGEKYNVLSDFEDKLEWLASYADACYKQDIPFSFALNIRASGKVPFVYLPLGSGDSHRIQAMELLSILSIANSLVPFDKLLAYLDIHEELPVATYVITNREDTFTPFLHRWEQRTNVIYKSSANAGGISHG
ncbi:DUF58 domain-containing protein [Psychrobacillus psychrodurans]|uniref:DUF58 domain-containing protein n=1 Tax=Psychrobacillus psychrodurans TaxID=126157 RepID=UPI001F4E8C2B|nr:DUF58 domain-containing protein [Psychrobacillus psychrodurans]MCK1996352.1 DUF58 domain-containing protein [Psychrobacillus psychrodurans]